MSVVDCHFPQLNQTCIDVATDFMRQLGPDGTPGSDHKVHVLVLSFKEKNNDMSHVLGV